MDMLKTIIMIALAAMPIISLSIYLLRKDIFINNLKFHLGSKGIDLNISTKEKNGSSSENDRSKLKN